MPTVRKSAESGRVNNEAKGSNSEAKGSNSEELSHEVLFIYGEW